MTLAAIEVVVSTPVTIVTRYCLLTISHNVHRTTSSINFQELITDVDAISLIHGPGRPLRGRHDERASIRTNFIFTTTFSTMPSAVTISCRKANR
ncbi:uncharacterized protein LACBIDRAFT_310694 [Laccaria bicolor S238N-H82]|uniref:Predicted protein n=1 Tax=Laccaria bicolor (strain S238N-H82 / ATCC MYA-4686) TaxID=486041 RepID=B0DUW9_LACBS|nr:uncharacterized protein LACBIDRAFT_310694 [Laccaria bicolor S238N-H82]EDR01684.1 predicted protein [Laccaria bicolor S238N-H82]|eukprot:XP_001887760.1 predicted protein [Laccaria bicolor S238N-H82]